MQCWLYSGKWKTFETFPIRPAKEVSQKKFEQGFGAILFLAYPHARGITEEDASNLPGTLWHFGSPLQ